MAESLTYIGALVLHAIRSGQRYGFQIMAATELASGTVYPALRRLEKSGLIRSQWEKAAVARAEQRPARKYYQVTPDGDEALTEAGKRFRFPDWEAAPKEAGQ
ncbi:MAG TPA: PadR family transcriptional regulator [Bryobacteraceae bacterium]|jgi:DNA-binding PadR family transcriptional regulator